MKPTTDRRSVLKYTLAGLACSALPPLAQRGVAQSGPAGFTRLNDRLSLIDAGGSNVLALDAGDGLLLVDSGMPSHAEALLRTLSRLHEGGVRTLFNTHWHAEQWGANEALGRAGAQIIAHQKTYQRLSTDYYLPHEQRYRRAAPEAARPDEFFFDTGSMTAGAERIDYGHLVQPHTDGDIYVWFREANVLAAGGAVCSEGDPQLDWYGGGWLGGRVNSLDRLLALTDEETVIVPAAGPVMDRAGLMAERDLMQEIYKRVLDLVREGCGAECMLEEGALDGLGRTWDDPHTFLYAAYKGMWAHHSNLAPNIL